MEEKDKLELALATAHSAIYQWNTTEDTIRWTGALEDVFGVGDEAIISTQEQLLAYLHTEDREKFLSSLETTLHHGGSYTRHYRFRLPDGTSIPLRDSGMAIEDGDATLLVGMITSTLMQAPMGTMVLASPGKRVHTTGDYARAEFMEALSDTFGHSYYNKRNNVLLKISIDNLPMLMTWYSLDFADRVMAALEFRLNELLRKDDVLHRTAIDQFSVVLKNQSESEAELVIDRILRRIQLYSNPSFEEPIHLRCSIGSLNFPADSDSPEDAMNKGYLALASARNKRSEFHVDYHRARRENLNLKEETGRLRHMQTAFRDKRIRLAYQPVVHARTGKVKSYECLLRADYEGSQLGSLGELIPIAEKMGIIDMVDQYVLESIIEELVSYPDIQLGFNVSNLTTNNPKWLKLCTSLLQNNAVADRLIIEITETAAQRDMRQTAYFVAALQELGCKVALDDFGAGYTSLRQLKSLSVDMVKIDGSYVIGLENNFEGQLFIKTLMEFSHAYGLETIAECVENGEVAKMLMNLNVDYMQGNYFGRADVARPWAGEKPSIEEQL